MKETMVKDIAKLLNDKRRALKTRIEGLVLSRNPIPKPIDV